MSLNLLKLEPSRTLRRAPEIADDTEEREGEDVPEGSDDPGNLPLLTIDIRRFEINLKI